MRSGRRAVALLLVLFAGALCAPALARADGDPASDILIKERVFYPYKLKLPPNVVHAPEGKSLQSMMKAGEIQAGFSGPAGVGRAGPPISGWDKAGAAAADTYPELIADVEKVEADWFRNSGIYPIHGLIVVKDEHIKRHPWLARSLMNAFVTAKKPYLDQLKQGQGDSPEDKRYGNFLSLMSDPLPYGIAANRPSIEALVTYSLQQKLIPSRPQLDQVFVDIDP